ncbi:hypothetical protein QJ850_gp814 [Acanthamoeba polyphaga mimivirus]|uniref:Uncharacterized protein n=1 Tax=Acanthamoeba polyphaga mimivirus Kroon TaxID=3069720 RepID=A0A0G2Y2A6_9VIRU|nr:hypothetical protein QJ850_gp814 [Acanthamoeba polyphaga mimivirus]AKI79885.1 hypothetical protein [Acanthamoeba polyphaga mimivirus Kroon]
MDKLSSVIKTVYYYPLKNTGWTNILVYKIILGLQGSRFMKFIQKKLIDRYIQEALEIPAYITISEENDGEIPIINKQTFHMRFGVKGRIPIGSSVKDFDILQTSGSTSGVPSKIPVSDIDVVRLRNYYINLAKISGDDVMPQIYRYVNMFPTSDSSTGRFSELLVPEEYRLERSNADPDRTLQIIDKAIFDNHVSEDVPLIVGGLPILHLMFLEKLQDGNEVSDYLKYNGICLYGGESPTIFERLKLYQYYHKLIGIYGSTEMGPKLGFAVEPNLIIDIALTIPEIALEITGTSDQPTSFFYDKYLHHFEIIDDSLINTPLIQQAELKIRWDQEDKSKLVDPIHLKNTLFEYRHLIKEKIESMGENNINLLQKIMNDVFYTNFYNKLFKYYGLVMLYGRDGIIFGGANLDSKFVEIILEKLKNESLPINYLAIHRNNFIEQSKDSSEYSESSEFNESSEDNIGISNYSGLTLNILVETSTGLNKSELLELKAHIIQQMEHQHHDFEQIMLAYKAKDQDDLILDNIKLWAFNSQESPMHDRYIKSGKRIYVIKKMDDVFMEQSYLVV